MVLALAGDSTITSLLAPARSDLRLGVLPAGLDLVGIWLAFFIAESDDADAQESLIEDNGNQAIAAPTP